MTNPNESFRRGYQAGYRQSVIDAMAGHSIDDQQHHVDEVLAAWHHGEAPPIDAAFSGPLVMSTAQSWINRDDTRD